MRQKMVGSVSATRANDCFHFGKTKHLMQFVHASAHSSGKKEFAIEDALREDRIEPEFAQPRDSRFKLLAVYRTGRRDDADRVSFLENTRTHQGWTLNAHE